MTNTHTAKLIAFRMLLKMRDFLTPAAKSNIMSSVIMNARKSGGRPKEKLFAG